MRRRRRRMAHVLPSAATAMSIAAVAPVTFVV